jgi:hypothetical protein
MTPISEVVTARTGRATAPMIHCLPLLHVSRLDPSWGSPLVPAMSSVLSSTNLANSGAIGGTRPGSRRPPAHLSWCAPPQSGTRQVSPEPTLVAHSQLSACHFMYRFVKRGCIRYRIVSSETKRVCGGGDPAGQSRLACGVAPRSHPCCPDAVVSGTRRPGLSAGRGRGGRVGSGWRRRRPGRPREWWGWPAGGRLGRVR